jgi:hypothetical protein
MTTWEFGRIRTYVQGAGFANLHWFHHLGTGASVTLGSAGVTWKETLSDMGKDGWQLSAVHNCQDEAGEARIDYYLQRPLP